LILQALKGYYDRVAGSEPGVLPPFGYSYEQIDYVLVLSPDGTPLGLQPLPEGRLCVPLVERTSDIKPKFLWDNTSYVFGVSDRSRRSEQEHARFKVFHWELIAAVNDTGLKAVENFLRCWDPKDFKKLINHEMALDKNLVFRLENERKFIHQHAEAERIWLTFLRSKFGAEGQCLVSGESAPIAELHPNIGGVRGAQTSGAYLVSFNATAFTSYQLKNGKNAPVSEHAAFEYTAALNALLSRTLGRTDKGQPLYSNRVQIADATTVFWAEAEKPEQSQVADNLMAWLFSPPAKDGDVDPAHDRQEASKVRNLLEAMAKGRPQEMRKSLADLGLSEGTRTFILGLSPNAARLSVRFWYQDTLGHLMERFAKHWENLRIDPPAWKTTAPAIWALLYEVAAQRKVENISPNLAGEVMRAILTGQPYPRSLFTAALMRCRAEQKVTGLRAAILKACLIGNKEGVPVSLDRNDVNPGYRLGRLFAVLESVQKTALPGLNATIRDRAYAAASATPGHVFPMLMRTANHHLANIRKNDKPGLAGWFEKEMGEIMLGLDGHFPKTLALEDQGRFAIGYYHQRFAKKADAPPGLNADADVAAENDTIKE
jgi:CRISPR-associated protein Csd1